MICKYPRAVAKAIFGCGWCKPCLIYERKVWATRMLLEAAYYGYENCSFVTLTYNDEHLPPFNWVYKDEAQRWQKRLRQLVPQKLRFFTIGEYGDKKGRPHYHSIIYGLSPQEAELVLQKSWKDRDGKELGHVHIGNVTKDSCFYVARYVTKKKGNSGHGSRGLDYTLSRLPEFALNRAKPGIGFEALKPITDFLTTDIGCDELYNAGDVPTSFKMNGRNFPLGKQLRAKLREKLNFPLTSKTGRTPSYSVYKENSKEKMQELLEEIKKISQGKSLNKFEVEGILCGLMESTVDNIEARFKLHDYRGLE